MPVASQASVDLPWGTIWLMALVLITVVVAAIVALRRLLNSESISEESPELEQLKKRYADGQISLHEYQQQQKLIQAH